LSLRDVPSTQDGETGRDEAAALGPGGRDHVDIEGPCFGSLAFGVERAHQGAPGKIASDSEVVAGGVDAGVDQGFDVAAVAQESDVERLLRQRLAQEAAL